MNPDRHATSHYDYFKNLIKGDDASAEAHRKFYDEYNAVLDMDADYYLETIKTVFQEYKLVHGTWDVARPKARSSACVPRTSPPRRCSPWKVNWTIFQARPNQGRPRPVHRHCEQGTAPPGSQGCRALRHLQWPPLAL